MPDFGIDIARLMMGRAEATISAPLGHLYARVRNSLLPPPNIESYNLPILRGRTTDMSARPSLEYQSQSRANLDIPKDVKDGVAI